MATQDLLTYKCKSLGYADVGAGAEASYTPLMGVLEGLSISQEAASESAINGEFYDTPLDSVGTLGSYKIEFDLVKYKPEEIAAMEGGQFTPSTGMYTMPSSFTNVYKQFKLEFYNGIDYIVIYKGKIVKIIKYSLFYAVQNNETADNLVRIIKLLTCKEIQSLLRQRNFHGRDLVIKQLCMFKNEIKIFGNMYSIL